VVTEKVLNYYNFSLEIIAEELWSKTYIYTQTDYQLQLSDAIFIF